MYKKTGHLLLITLSLAHTASRCSVESSVNEDAVQHSDSKPYEKLKSEADRVSYLYNATKNGQEDLVAAIVQEETKVFNSNPYAMGAVDFCKRYEEEPLQYEPFVGACKMAIDNGDAVTLQRLLRHLDLDNGFWYLYRSSIADHAADQHANLEIFKVLKDSGANLTLIGLDAFKEDRYNQKEPPQSTDQIISNIKEYISELNLDAKKIPWSKFIRSLNPENKEGSQERQSMVLDGLLTLGFDIETRSYSRAYRDSLRTPSYSIRDDHDVRTPLEEAIYYGANKKLVDRLKQAEFEQKQRTELHQVVRFEKFENLEKLLASGADIEARDIEGHTPLDYAVKNGNTSAVRILLGADAEHLPPNFKVDDNSPAKKADFERALHDANMRKKFFEACDPNF